MDTEALEIVIQGQDAASPIHDVQEWLRHEEIPGLRIEQKAPALTEGHMGALSNVLAAILNPKNYKELIVSLFKFLTTKRSKLKFTVKAKDWQVTLDGENLTGQDAVLKHIESLVAAARGK
jgi:hypothetical protein